MGNRGLAGVHRPPLVAIVLALGIAPCGCRTQGLDSGLTPKNSVSHSTPLKSQDIRNAIIGRSFIEHGNVVVVSGGTYTKTYCSDGGTMLLSGPRGVSRGTYSIEGNRLCTSMSPGQSSVCRFVYKNDNHFLSKPYDSNSDAITSLVRMIPEPTNQFHVNCSINGSLRTYDR